MDFLDQLKFIFLKNISYILGGMLGVVIAHVKKKQHLNVFFGNVFVASVIGYFTGILMKNFTNFSNEIIFIACTLTGLFHDKLLNEIKDMIPLGNKWIRKQLSIDEDEAEKKDEDSPGEYYDSTKSDTDEETDTDVKNNNNLEKDGGL